MNSPSAGRYLLLCLFISGLCIWRPSPGIAHSSPRTDYLGDPLPEGALFRLGTARLRHPETIERVRFLDGQKLIATGYTMPSVWDVETGRRIPTEASEFELVDKSTSKATLARTNPALWRMVAFARDENTLLAVDYDDIVTAWDIRSGKETKKEQQGLIEALDADRKVPGSALAQFSDPLTGQEKQTQVGFLQGSWSLAKDGKHVSLAYSNSGERGEIEQGPKWAVADGFRTTLSIPEKKVGCYQ